MNCLTGFLRRTLVFILFAGYPAAKAQVFDDFSDGNFTSNPEWQGDTQQFQITSSSAIPPEMKPALQLNSTGSDISSLHLPNSQMMNTEWRFWIKLSFNTSANNFARVYLVSDQENLEGPLNGYFVEVGGDSDGIAIIKQVGLSFETIISGTIAYTGNSTNVLRIKITHDFDNNWNLYSNMDGGYNFVLEGSSGDNTFSATSFFGIYCKYTSSNSTKFYFDDFYVNEIVIDTIPPEITAINMISNTQLDLILNEPVEISSAQNILNYYVNTIGNPVNATRDLFYLSKVHLTFEQSFTPGINYILTVNGVADLAGNLMENVSADFQFQPPSQIELFDVVINEIMTDVNPPPVGLPEADYLELYNRTNAPINLENCTIKPRESANPIVFPNVIIQPGSFLIVVQTSDVSEFVPFGSVTGLPGFTMNNEGTVVLRNPEGHLICSVSYTDEWYNDDVKKAGGWALEQIDPHHPCSGKANWTASSNLVGGTPGTQNSVNGLNISLPEILSVEISGLNTLTINFSHFMDSLALINPTAYWVDQDIGYPTNIGVTGNMFNTVSLGFDGGYS